MESRAITGGFRTEEARRRRASSRAEKGFSIWSTCRQIVARTRSGAAEKEERMERDRGEEKRGETRKYMTHIPPCFFLSLFSTAKMASILSPEFIPTSKNCWGIAGDRWNVKMSVYIYDLLYLWRFFRCSFRIKERDARFPLSKRSWSLVEVVCATRE